MFWEPQNASLHHEGEEILLPTVAESECTNCRQCIEICKYICQVQFILPLFAQKYVLSVIKNKKMHYYVDTFVFLHSVILDSRI